MAAGKRDRSDRRVGTTGIVLRAGAGAGDGCFRFYGHASLGPGRPQDRDEFRAGAAGVRGAVRRPDGGHEADADRPAAGHLLLHLPRPVLPDRRLPAAVRGQPLSARGRPLHRLLPAADRGADRPLSDHRAATALSAA